MNKKIYHTISCVGIICTLRVDSLHTVPYHWFNSLTSALDTKANVLYEQALTVFECGAQLLEQTEESFNLLINQINWDELTPDQKAAFQGWHKGIQQATTSIRCPE